jgi:formate-dependent nitrite reductase membrane component NrfD
MMEPGRARARQLDDDTSFVDSVGMQQEISTISYPPTRMDIYREIPHVDQDPTYYDRPILKEPTWIWTVPAYFYAGGLGGSAAIMAAALDPRGQRQLARRLRQLGLAATIAGSGLLIADLGRPERFLNMLRVLRVTSPMSVGSWVLAANGGMLSASVACAALGGGLSGPWSLLARSTGFGSALLSAAQCTYPAVLLSCTAVPVWQETRLTLPFLFAASAAGSLGSLYDMLGQQEPALQQFSNAGKAIELVAAVAVEKDAGRTGQRVARPLKEGLSGKLWRASAVLTGTSLALSLLPGKAAWKRRLSGVCGTAGAIALRFAALEAGKASARDPRASFHPQRARLAKSSDSATPKLSPECSP